MGSPDKGVVFNKREQKIREALVIMEKLYPGIPASIEWIPDSSMSRNWLITLRAPGGTIRRYVGSINPPPSNLLRGRSKLKGEGVRT